MYLSVCLFVFMIMPKVMITLYFVLWVGPEQRKKILNLGIHPDHILDTKK